MKTSLLFSILAIAGLGIYSCDVDYNAPAIPTTKTSCINAVDASTNQPLDSVQVQMTLRYKDTDTTAHDVDFQSNTDASGNTCVTYDKGSSENYLMTVSRPGYSPYTFGDDVNWFYIDPEIEVKLLPAGYLQFHVKNEAPNADDDFFVIILPNDYGLAADTLILQGGNVDTTWVKTISVGNHNLEWVYSDNLAGIISVEEQYLVERNITEVIEILY